MNIIGPDYIVFGVEDRAACDEFLTAFSLTREDLPDGSTLYKAADETGLIIRDHDDPLLPAPLPTGSTMRQQVYGVVDQSDLDAIRAELSTDREVRVLDDGALECVDDQGFALKFQVTIRKPITMKAERINAPGDEPGRALDETGVWDGMPTPPRSLSHQVLFVPDLETAENFYINRLKFRLTDRMKDVGPFLRPMGTNDHHTLFFIRVPEYMQGLEHAAFHMAGPTEVMVAGTRMMNAGFESHWGPGRHKFASNWFWYFKSPMGCSLEFDADMDKHSDDWEPRVYERGAENSQMFLLQHREKWTPGAARPK